MTRRFVSAFFALVSLAIVTPAFADDDVIYRYRLPAGRRVTVAGEQYQAYNLDESLELLEMDSDLRAQTDRIHLLEEQAIQLKLSVENYEEAAVVGAERMAACSEKVSLLDVKIQEDTKSYIKDVTLLQRRSRVGWSIAGVSVVALGASILGLILGGG